MQSVPVFLDITKFADFRRKNADIRKTQGVCYVIDIFFIFIRSGKFCHVSSCVADFREGEGFCPLPLSVSSPKSAHPEQG